MTVASVNSTAAYAGNGVTTVFAIPFYFLENAHILATLRAADGTETTQVIVTNYTLTGAGNPSGGSITMLAAVPSLTTLYIRRSVPATQLTDYTANDPFPAETHERALDKLTMLAQESDYLLGRALLLRETDTDGDGAFDARSNRITNLEDPSVGTDAVTLSYLNDNIAALLSTAGAVTPRVWEATGDGATVVFAIPGATIGVASAYYVFLDGAGQTPDDDYTVNATTQQLTFVVAPPNLAKVVIRNLGFEAPIVPDNGLGDTAKLYRGDNVFAKSVYDVIGSVLPTNTLSAFDFSKNVDGAGIRVGAPAGGTSAVMFSNIGDTDPYKMRFGYNATLDALVWSAYGSTVFGQLRANGDMVLGTYNSLFVDRANSRVGIGGVIAPTQALDVLGNVVWSGTATGNMPASNITSGIIAPERLGTGSGSATTFLAGDGVFRVPTGGGGGGNTVIVYDAFLPAASYDTIQLLGQTGGTGTSFDLYISAVSGTQATLRGKLPVHAVTLHSIAQPLNISVLGGATAGATYFDEITAGADNDVLRRSGGVLGFGTIPAASLSASGTADATHFLAGDNVWRIPTASATSAVDSWVLNDSSVPRDIFKIKPFTAGSLVTQFQAYDGAAFRNTFAISWSSGGVTVSNLLVASGTGMFLGSLLSDAIMTLGCAALTISATTLNLVAGTVTRAALATGTGPFILGATTAAVGQPVATLTAAQATSVMIAFVGDSGAGGTKGLVPAPAAGDTAAAKFLRADGTWAAISAGISVTDSATIDLSLVAGVLSGVVLGGSIGTAQLTNLGVTAAKIASGTITSLQMGALSIGTAALIDASVTTAKLGLTSVGTAQLIDASVTTAKLAAASVTIAKISATGTPSSTTFLNGAGAWATPAAGGSVDVTLPYAWTAGHSWTTAASGVSTTLGVPAASATSAALTLFRNSRPGAGPLGDRSGALYFDTYRDGGLPNNNALFGYQVNANHTAGFDIGMTLHGAFTRVNGGTGDNLWFIINSPSSNPSAGVTVGAHSWTSGLIRTGEINFGNRWADFGLLRTLGAGQLVSGPWLVPDTSLCFDGVWPDDVGNAFNASFGLAFSRAVYGGSGTGVGGATKAQTWVHIMMDTDSCVPGGIHFLSRGGSVSGQAPLALIEARDNFSRGIDLSNANFTTADKEAIRLGDDQSIKFGSDAKIYWDSAALKLAFYSTATGVKYFGTTL